jgi:protein YibB
MDTSLTLVTGFWDINRQNWDHYSRSTTMYLQNAQRVLTINHPLIVFIQPDLVDWVKKNRAKYLDYTVVVPLEVTELPYYNLIDKIKSIMDSDEYKSGLADGKVPEVCNPLYDVLIWSKLPLIIRAISMNPFKSSHFGWIDFGFHLHGLKDYYLNTQILYNTPNKIRILTIMKPKEEDLNIKEFFKSHKVSLLAALLTGSIKNLIIFNKMADQVIREAISLNVVDSEQSIYAICYLKNPSLFDLYYGSYEDVINKYNVSKVNKFNAPEKVSYCIPVDAKCISNATHQFWAIIFETSDGIQIHRADANSQEVSLIKKNIDGEKYTINRSFTTLIKPDFCTVWPFSNNWENKISINLYNPTTKSTESTGSEGVQVK